MSPLSPRRNDMNSNPCFSEMPPPLSSPPLMVGWPNTCEPVVCSRPPSGKLETTPFCHARTYSAIGLFPPFMAAWDTPNYGKIPLQVEKSAQLPLAERSPRTLPQNPDPRAFFPPLPDLGAGRFIWFACRLTYPDSSNLTTRPLLYSKEKVLFSSLRAAFFCPLSLITIDQTGFLAINLPENVLCASSKPRESSPKAVLVVTSLLFFFLVENSRAPLPPSFVLVSLVFVRFNTPGAGDATQRLVPPVSAQEIKYSLPFP